MTIEGSQDFAGLRWIRREIEENLRQSRLALEDFAEGERDSLAPVIAWLHQIRGALTMVQVHGAAMLAEETEHLARALDEGRVSDRETAEESLMLGIAQLPVYLDRIEGGQPDIPMILLPVMNELRAARGVRGVSEASLFAPGLAAQLAGEPVVPGSGNEMLAERARDLRPRYHRWLADWLRGKERPSAIKHLRGILDQLSSMAGTARLRRLLDTADALLLACLEGDVKDDAALKLLFGRLDRVLKDLADRGEEAVANDFPASLYRELLYFIARSASADPAIQAARQAAEQANSFATDRAGTLAPGRELFQTVAGVLADDLVAIKDQLDLYMRGDRQALDRLAGLVDPIQRMADTLGMVGQGQLRGRLIPRVDAIRTAVASGSAPTEDTLTTLAWDLLAVESALKSLGDAGPGGAEASEPAGGTPDLSEGEYREHLRSALGQVFIELARVREAVDEYLASGEADCLDPLPKSAQTLAGVISVIGDREVAGLLADLGGYFSALREGRLEPPNETQRESLGELITGIEIHLGGMLEPTPESHRALGAALAAAESLGLSRQREDGMAVVVQDSAVAFESEEVETGDGASPVSLPVEDLSAAETLDEAEKGELDSEILAIFIEEAREALDTLRERFPRWREAVDDAAALAEVRRAFHTLKGSGRLVGALEIGEFAWALENMLNRVIDQTVAVTPPLLDLVAEAIEALPALIEAREKGRPSTVDPVPLQERADALAAGEIPGEGMISAEVSSVAEPEPEIERIGGEAEDRLEIDLESAESPGISREAEDLPVSDETPSEFESVPEVIGSEEVAGMEQEAESLILELGEKGDGGSVRAPTEVSLLQEDESILTPAAEGQAPIQLEEALREVFVREAAGHLETIGRFVDHCRGLANGSPYDDELKRALHTLRGSARMADVEPVAQVAGALEDWAGLLSSQGARTDQKGLDLLERGYFMIGAMLKVINVPGASLPAWQALVEEVRGLCEAMAQGPGEAEAREAGKASIGDEGDEELTDIFVEEARELFEQLETAFAEWRSRPDDLLPVAQLQRGLHTLKGGARLAGVTAAGDLGHALESLFEGVVEQRVEVDSRMLGLCRHALDRLAGQIEMLDSGRLPSEETELVEAIQSAAAGRDWSLPVAVDQVSTSLAEEATEESSLLSRGVEEAEERESAGVGAAVGQRSTLLSDSQLLTDSELLAESDLAATTSALVAGEGDVSGLQLDSRIIQFPARGRHAENEEDFRAPPPPPEEETKATSHERVRVRGDLLDQLVNHAGEVSIYGARLEQQNRALGLNLDELTDTIQRLRGQLRQLENETEAQILARFEREHQGELPAGFDPLEMDRYSTIQQLSRALSETTDDLGNLGNFLQDLARDTETLLQQQGRVVNDLQDGLLRTRMVPIGSRASRLQRVVRQTAQALGKQAELTITGATGEMDRVILERMMGPLEHLFRNAVAHGIEPPEKREAAGKPAVGNVSLVFGREGADVLLEVVDDGRGLDREAIRRKAIERGLLDAGAHVEGEDLDAFILEPGFSTTDEVNQVAGRGVGMDVVVNEIKQLGGTLEIDSQPGSGTRFTIRLPFTLAITEALLVAAGQEVYAIPHGGTEGVVRIPREELEACYRGERTGIFREGREYPVRYLGRLLGTGAPQLAEGERWFPALLVRSGEHRLAVQVDRVLGHRQIVVKSMGAQLASLRWFTGGTILADGDVALILDTGALVRGDAAYQSAVEPELSAVQDTGGVRVMVVDDSITVRKVTSRLLERHNMRVSTARDGVDAITLLQEERPDIVLLDIEMPRMDGFELARHMRNTNGLKDIPIIMITSRTGEKHREYARDLGVNRYLGKPYQESDLLENIYTVLAETES